MQKACEQHNGAFKFLYPLNLSIKEKIGAIVASYGADGVEYSPEVGSLHCINFMELISSHESLLSRKYIRSVYSLECCLDEGKLMYLPHCTGRHTLF